MESASTVHRKSGKRRFAMLLLCVPFCLCLIPLHNSLRAEETHDKVTRMIELPPSPNPAGIPAILIDRIDRELDRGPLSFENSCRFLAKLRQSQFDALTQGEMRASHGKLLQNRPRLPEMAVIGGNFDMCAALGTMSHSQFRQAESEAGLPVPELPPLIRTWVLDAIRVNYATQEQQERIHDKTLRQGRFYIHANPRGWSRIYDYGNRISGQSGSGPKPSGVASDESVNIGVEGVNGHKGRSGGLLINLPTRNTKSLGARANKSL